MNFHHNNVKLMLLEKTNSDHNMLLSTSIKMKAVLCGLMCGDKSGNLFTITHNKMLKNENIKTSFVKQTL